MAECKVTLLGCRAVLQAALACPKLILDNINFSGNKVNKSQLKSLFDTLKAQRAAAGLPNDPPLVVVAKAPLDFGPKPELKHWSIANSEIGDAGLLQPNAVRVSSYRHCRRQAVGPHAIQCKQHP